ncbi:hypothetical protein BGZ83_009086 [Gryganskiella cystojenkinii]|nr:hypothetical protein BGZ83_009086 [Gryganskiella cystojenkinii]
MPTFRKLSLMDNHPIANVLFCKDYSAPHDEKNVDPFYCSGSSDDYDDDFLYDDQEDDSWDKDFILSPKTLIQQQQRLKPSSRQRRRQRSSLQKAAPLDPRLIPLTPTVSKPLVFPLEILNMVCHYLSQATLRFCASLVSRRWSVVCNRYIKRTVIWKPLSDDYDRFVLEALQELDSLELWLHQDPEVYDNHLPFMSMAYKTTAWVNFQTALLAPLSDNDGTCLMNKIRNLRLLCSPSQHTMSYLDLLQYQFSSLRSLDLIVSQTPTGQFPLFVLLDNSPELRQLKITGPWASQWNLAAGDNDDLFYEPPEPEVDPETAHFPVKPKAIIPPNKSYPQRYKLEVFDTYRVNFAQHLMERLISTCPELQVFKVLDSNDRFWDIDRHIYRTHKIRHQRLFDHLRDCCPRIESCEVLPRTRTFTDILYLDQTRKYFPEAKSITLNCSGYLPNPPPTRTFLSQITCLHIRLSTSPRTVSSDVNRVLCMTPNLLHLVSKDDYFNTLDLYYLPEESTSSCVSTKFVTHNKTRKNIVREQRRARRRASQLVIEQASERARLAREGPREEEEEDQDPEIPLIWQCRDLRTIDLRLGWSSDELGRFGLYVSQHHLFQTLTSLKIRLKDLNLGQCKTRPDHKKAPTGAKAQAVAAARTTPAASPPPEKFPNDLENLYDLPSLELLAIYTSDLGGMLHSSDFEFLRRVPSLSLPTATASRISTEFSSNSSTMALPDENVEPVMFSPAEAKIATRLPDNDNKKSNNKDGQHSQTQRQQQQQQQPPAPDAQRHTCWPRLQMFKIGYCTSPLVLNYSKVVEGMEKIRPGVEFQIKMMTHSAMELL